MDTGEIDLMLVFRIPPCVYDGSLYPLSSCLCFAVFLGVATP